MINDEWLTIDVVFNKDSKQRRKQDTHIAQESMNVYCQFLLIIHRVSDKYLHNWSYLQKSFIAKFELWGWIKSFNHLHIILFLSLTFFIKKIRKIKNLKILQRINKCNKPFPRSEDSLNPK